MFKKTCDYLSLVKADVENIVSLSPYSQTDITVNTTLKDKIAYPFKAAWNAVKNFFYDVGVALHNAFQKITGADKDRAATEDFLVKLKVKIAEQIKADSIEQKNTKRLFETYKILNKASESLPFNISLPLLFANICANINILER